jgi:hypothetical protein
MLSVASLAIVDSRAAAIASWHAINCAIIVQWHPWQQLRSLRGYVAPIIRAWSSSRCEVPDVPQTTHHPCTLQLRCGRHRLVPDYTFACTADMACTGFTFYAPQTALVQEAFSPSLTAWHKICDVPFNARSMVVHQGKTLFPICLRTWKTRCLIIYDDLTTSFSISS